MFQNPCTFGDACVFGSGCQLIVVNWKKPPHQTGAACVFDTGCTIIYTKIGSDNIIQEPATYEPVSQGGGTIVGNSNHKTWPSSSVTGTAPPCQGQIVSGDKVSKDWCEASKVTGFDVESTTTVKRGDC